MAMQGVGSGIGGKVKSQDFTCLPTALPDYHGASILKFSIRFASVITNFFDWGFSSTTCNNMCKFTGMVGSATDLSDN
jgi:hypothetical protein